ncbi:enterochelin esterase [Streptomyces spiroverticillatus]|uniref:Enterochelin esterase n=1 Tax=Streptomyces finlayi TaxID=67296 RepID=A0A918WV84_9ACTN|nr:enterochelin esterase [Streptomyces spiroverticillatus]GHC86540.1 enterochelin esterase [Streptomyces finlayi]
MLLSPLLRALSDDVRAQKPGAERDFWTYAQSVGTPLVEPDPDPSYRLVTFVLRDDVRRPATDVLALLHTVTDRDRHAGNLLPHLMDRIPGTDVWAITHRLRADLRASYQFAPAYGSREETVRTDRRSWIAVLDRAVPDPLNRTLPLPSGSARNPASVLSLPDAPPQPWVRHREAVARGELREEVVDGRRVTVHLPPSPPQAVAVLLDGEMWAPVLNFADSLDNLHAENRLPPTATLFVDTMGNRMQDLACHAPFVDWLADTLLPWATERFGTPADPARTVLAGQSMGGLTATYAGLVRPDRFGRILAQSGSFWWPDGDAARGAEWLTAEFARADPSPGVRFRLEAGTQEWMLLEENRRMRDVLRTGGHDLSYTEFTGGHDYACWRGGLADGLVQLLARPRIQ